MRFKVFCLLSIFLCFGSLCFASVSASDLQRDLLKLKNANMISDGCYQSALYGNSNSINNGSSSSYGQIKYGMNSNNDYAIILKRVSNDIRLVVAFPNTSSQHTYSYFYNPYSSGSLKYDWSGYSYYINSNLVSDNGNFTYGGMSDTDDIVYIYTTCGVHTRSWDLEADEEWGGNYIVEHPPTFTPTSARGFVSVNYNGNSTNFHKLPFSLSVYQIELGTISNFNTDNVYQIIGQFGAYVGQDNLNNDIIDSNNRFTFTRLGDNSYDVKNGSLKFDSNTGKVYILTNKLIENQGYNLYFEYYTSSSQYGGDFGNTNYYAVSLYFNGTSGDLINPNLNSGVDINFINSINDFYTNDIMATSGNLINPIDFNLSGEMFYSKYADKMGFSYNNNNRYDLFVYRIYRNVLNIFANDNSNAELDITIRNHNINLKASDFLVPNGPLKVFVRLFLLARFCYFVLSTNT